MNAHPAAGSDHFNPENLDPETFDYDPGYPQTYDIDFGNAYDRVTARDIADLLHHLAEMRCSTPAGVNNVIDPAERAAFLSRKADLFTRIARPAERTRVDVAVQPELSDRSAAVAISDPLWFDHDVRPGSSTRRRRVVAGGQGRGEHGPAR